MLVELSSIKYTLLNAIFTSNFVLNFALLVPKLVSALDLQFHVNVLPVVCTKCLLVPDQFSLQNQYD